MSCLFPAENEIEIFERKFLAPLSTVSRSVSSTRIVISNGEAVDTADTRVMSSVSPVSVSSSSSSGTGPPQHVRVLRTSSKVSQESLSAVK